MPTYFVTGATGFIGRHLVERLLEREGDIHVLVREGSTEKLEALVERLGGGDRIHAVTGDLSEPLLGVDDGVRDALRGKVDHFFHLAAIYDMTADETQNALLNVGGTQNAVDLANDLEAGIFHHASSIAVGRHLRGPLHRGHVRRGPEAALAVPPTKFESEKLVRDAREGRLARLPAGDRRRRLAHRRDGQDRRAVLLLQGAPEGAPRAAAVVPARSASRSAGRTSCRSTGSRPRSTTSRTSRTSTARRSTSSTRARSAPATCSTRSPAPGTRRRWCCGSTSG